MTTVARSWRRPALQDAERGSPAGPDMPTAISHVDGHFLILSAGPAFYGAGALMINSALPRPVLPLLSQA